MVKGTSPRAEVGQWAHAHWPWLLVAAGWGTALGVTAGGQDWVLNHHILIEGAA